MALQAIAVIGVSQVAFGPGYYFPGTITGPGDPTQFADGIICAKVGDAIAYHGPGAHVAAVMVTGSPDTFVDGLALCRVGDLASCGCQIIAGDEDTFVL